MSLPIFTSYRMRLRAFCWAVGSSELRLNLPGKKADRRRSLLPTRSFKQDLAHPDTAKKWVPSGWLKPTNPGTGARSACVDRWLKITNQAGISCYAQWEDFGPGSDDDAEYVFGDKPPKFEQGAGIDLSPSTAKFLNIDDKTRIVSWQFVDEKNVPPGPWLSDQPEPYKPETQPQAPVKAGTGSIMAGFPMHR
jgi:hypothetical protein